MICPKCGTPNPAFFDKCVECGARLPKAGGDDRKRRLLVYGIFGACALAALAVIAIALPAISGGLLALFAFFHGGPASSVPRISQFGIGEPARYGDLQVTVTGARDGTMFNDRKFYTVTAELQNYRSQGSLHFAAGDFPLIDSRGEVITPLGIGDGITYDLAPGATGTIDLRYLIMAGQEGLRLRIDPSIPLGEASGTTVYYDFML